MDTSVPVPTPDPRSAQSRVLVADGDHETLDMLGGLLVADGLVVVTAQTGADAVALLDTFHPDLVLLDARLPGADGFATVTRMRALDHGSSLVMVMMVASDDAGAIEHAFAAGADDVLVKPLNAALLRMRVHHLLESRRSARDLEASERRFQRAFDDAACGTVIMALDGRYLRVNAALCTMFGYTAGELTERSVQDVTHPDDLPMTVSALAEMAAGRLRSYQAEKRYVRKDGTIVWCLLSAAVVQDADESVPSIIIQVQDITARKEAETALRESEARFRTLFECSPDGMVLIDPHDPSGTWPIVDCNPSFCAMNGYTCEEIVGQSIDLFNPGPDFYDAGASHLERIRATGMLRDEDVQRRKDGTLMPIEYTTTLVTLGGRELILGIDRDITARKQMEEALRASEERFRLLFEHSPDAIWLLDPHDPNVPWSIVDCNAAACELHGYTREELIGQPSSMFAVEPRDPEALQHEGERTAEFLRTGHIVSEDRHRRKDGTIIDIEYTDTMVVINGRELVLGIDRDVTERKRYEAELLRHAFYDRLTGLPNRALFLDRLQQVLERQRRGAAGACAVFFLDLDVFKVVNDSLGHPTGDRLLVDIGQRLSSVMDASDTLARFGGDEFAVLAEDVEDTSQAVQVAERIQAVFAAPFTLPGHQISMSASIGMAVTSTGEEAPDDLLRNADIAMYQAKTTGKGRHVLFDPAMHTHALARLQVATDLRHAIEREEFVLHYQPIVRCGMGDVCGVEALVRWQHPERGMIPPDLFIAVAEETGLIVPLGTSILRAACQQMAAWKAEGVVLHYVSVNLATQQVQWPDLAATIRATLNETGVDPSSLALEVTETGMMRDIERATSVLGQLRATGIRMLAIDDFGTGYASLSYLQQLPVTHIKIDRAFVHDITTNPGNAALVRAMIAMAHGLNLQTIAEGVETDEQRSLLQSYGCDAFQGYLVSRPLPADALLLWLQGR